MVRATNKHYTQHKIKMKSKMILSLGMMVLLAAGCASQPLKIPTITKNLLRHIGRRRKDRRPESFCSASIPIGQNERFVRAYDEGHQEQERGRTDRSGDYGRIGSGDMFCSAHGTEVTENGDQVQIGVLLSIITGVPAVRYEDRLKRRFTIERNCLGTRRGGDRCSGGKGVCRPQRLVETGGRLRQAGGVKPGTFIMIFLAAALWERLPEIPPTWRFRRRPAMASPPGRNQSAHDENLFRRGNSRRGTGGDAAGTADRHDVPDQHRRDRAMLFVLPEAIRSARHFG